MTKAEEKAMDAYPLVPAFGEQDMKEREWIRYGYVKGYEQAEKDKNEEIYNNKTVLPKAEAVKFAFDLFDQFAKELITALGNTAKMKRAAVIQNMMPAFFTNTNLKELAKTEAEADAFDEIKDRIIKEYTLIMQPIEYNWSIDEIFSKMKMSKNLDADTLINEDKYRGRNDFHKLMVFKSKLADMLEHYACSSFDLGVRYQGMKDKGENTQKFKDLVIDELEKINKPNREDIEL